MPAMDNAVVFNIDNLRSQVQLHHHIAVRDLPKRFVSVQFLLFSLWMVGKPGVATAIFTTLLVLEVGHIWVLKTMPPLTRISRGRVALVLGLCLLASLFYYLPGLLLTFEADLGLFTGGFIWLLMALMTSLVMYNALPAVYAATAVVGIPMLLYAVFAAKGHLIEPATPNSWYLPIVLVFVFIANNLQQLWEYRDTHRELRTTRVQVLKNLRKMEKKSLHDDLTGLPNRAAFAVDFEKRLGEVASRGALGKLVVDLDGFKPINDLHGHNIGDRVLQVVAERLQEVCGKAAKAYRLGGDEFAMIAMQLSKAELTGLAHDCLASIKRPIVVGKLQLSVGASIGIARTERPDMESKTLCVQADEAMYRAKASDTQHVVMFDDKSDVARMTATRQSELMLALHTGQIGPVYQPKFTAKNRRFVGLEALARWDHPDLGILRPKAFLQDIQEAGLLPELTQVMMSEVLSDVARWQQRGLDVGSVSVNIPAIVLAHDSGCAALGQILADHADVAQHLAFEITEDVYTKRASAAIVASIRRFRKMGIAIYLDDFGTGHGSYQHLLAMTPDQIKIDGFLVSQLADDAPAATVVAGIIAIAHGVGAKVVAEMVETEQQYNALRVMGCDFVEGYFLSSELEPDQVIEFLSKKSHRTERPNRKVG